MQRCHSLSRRTDYSFTFIGSIYCHVVSKRLPVKFIANVDTWYWVRRFSLSFLILRFVPGFSWSNFLTGQWECFPLWNISKRFFFPCVFQVPLWSQLKTQLKLAFSPTTLNHLKGKHLHFGQECTEMWMVLPLVLASFFFFSE